MTARSEIIREAIQDSFFAWLQDHPVSLRDILEDAIRRAVRDWLDAHSAEVLEAVAGTTRTTTEEES